MSTTKLTCGLLGIQVLLLSFLNLLAAEPQSGRERGARRQEAIRIAIDGQISSLTNFVAVPTDDSPPLPHQRRLLVAGELGVIARLLLEQDQHARAQQIATTAVEILDEIEKNTGPTYRSLKIRAFIYRRIFFRLENALLVESQIQAIHPEWAGLSAQPIDQNARNHSLKFNRGDPNSDYDEKRPGLAFQLTESNGPMLQLTDGLPSDTILESSTNLVDWHLVPAEITDLYHSTSQLLPIESQTSRFFRLRYPNPAKPSNKAE